MGWILKHYQNLETHQINKDVFLVGRDKEADLICRNILVSKHHSEITLDENGQLAIKDLKSSNGTYINEERIIPFEKMCLKDGDMVSFGIGKPNEIINKGQPNYIFNICKVPDVIEILTSDDEFEIVPQKKPRTVKEEINLPCSMETVTTQKPLVNIQQTNSLVTIVNNDTHSNNNDKRSNINDKQSSLIINNIDINSKLENHADKIDNEENITPRRKSMECIKAGIQDRKSKRLKVVLPKMDFLKTETLEEEPSCSKTSKDEILSKQEEFTFLNTLKDDSNFNNKNVNPLVGESGDSKNMGKVKNLRSANKRSLEKVTVANSTIKNSSNSKNANNNSSDKVLNSKNTNIKSSDEVCNSENTNDNSSDTVLHSQKTNVNSSDKVYNSRKTNIKSSNTVLHLKKTNTNSSDKVSNSKNPNEDSSDKVSNSKKTIIKSSNIVSNSKNTNDNSSDKVSNLKNTNDNSLDKVLNLRSTNISLEAVSNIKNINTVNSVKKVEVIENRVIIPVEKPTCSKYLDGAENTGEHMKSEKKKQSLCKNVDLEDDEVNMEIGGLDFLDNLAEDLSVGQNDPLVGKIHIATNLFSAPKEEQQKTAALPNGQIKTEPSLDYSIGDNVIVLDDEDDEDMDFMLSQLYIKPEIKVEEITETDATSTDLSNENEVISVDDEDDELFTSVCSQMYIKEEEEGETNKDKRTENNKQSGVDDEIFMSIKKEVAALDSYDVPTHLPPIVLYDTIDYGDSDDIFDLLNRTNEPKVVAEKVEMPSCSKENIEGGKGGYTMPPIVEPHEIVPPVAKRKRSSAGSKAPIEPKKSKSNVKKSPKGKSKIKQSPVRTASSKQNKDIQDARRQKLKEIALKTTKADPIKSPEVPKIKTAKHTKTSSSRGNFLLPSDQPANNTRNARPTRHEQITKTNCNVAKKRFVDEFRDVVHSILLWNQKWIFEQKNKHVLPPIAGREVIKMCDSFSSHKDYYNVLQPLIMAELWFNFCKEYESSSIFKQNNSNGNLIAKIDNVKTNSLYTEIMFTSYLDKKSSDAGNHIQMKNIALLNAYFGMGKTSCKTFFGVVVWYQKDPLKLDGKVDQKMMRMCKSPPTTKLTFMLVVKKFSESINTEHHVNMRYFTFLPQYLRLIDAVKQLATSPLLKHIIDPQTSLFNVKHQRRKPIIGDSLNESQSQALNDVMHLFESNKPGMYLLEGPPGTGKSTVIISIIIEWLVNLGVKNKCILLLAPSNGAVDSIINKIMFLVKPMLKEQDRQKIKLVRVGNTTAIDPKIFKYSLDEIAKAAVHVNFMRDHPQTQKDYNYLGQQISDLNKKLTQNLNDRELLRELERKTSERTNFAQNYLKSKYRSKLEEQKLVVLGHANVICSTLMSSHRIFTKGFDASSIKMCIVDEASQCSEAESLMPIGLGINKIVLVGDPQQLPAISSSVLVKNYGYCRSLFSRIKLNLTRQAQHPIKMLDIQYRMHPEICQFPNNEYYDGRIKTNFHYKKPLEQLKPYLVFSQSAMNTSEYENKKEIELLISLIKAISSVVAKELCFSIGIITPYSVQRSSINAELKKQCMNRNITITCNTVDSFQGQEKDLILLSCVRNTPNSFLSDVQRLNVSLTRAKYALYIIASETLLKSCPVLKKINNDAKKRRLVHDLRGSASQSMFVDLIRNKK